MTVAVIDRNDVVLRGRMSAPAELRTLPSGDPLVTFRLVVRREHPRTTGQVDTLDCVTFDRALQRRAAVWRTGDVVEVEGALQRRFWRTGAGTTTSRYEVNCRRGRKVARTAAAAEDRTA
jgi:single-strand DNA-binding protein